MSEEEIPVQIPEVPQQQEPKKKKRLSGGARKKIKRLMVTHLKNKEVEEHKAQGNVTAAEFDVTDVKNVEVINGQYVFKTSWADTDESPLSFADNPYTLQKLCPMDKNKSLKYIRRDIMKKHFHNKGKSFKVILDEATQNKILQIEKKRLNPERVIIQTNLTTK